MAQLCRHGGNTFIMIEPLRKIVDSNFFQYFILGCILLAAVLVGLETYPQIEARYENTLEILNAIVLWIFVVEAAMKMAQHGKHFYRYFYDPWNLFDFTIVVVCFLPVNASYAAVLRLARIMRALRLMTAMPQLQLIVGALIKSIPSMGYVGILLALNFYVYAVMGVFLFRANDPFHFYDLQTAMLTLFRVVTLEDWTDVMYINMYGSDMYGGYDDLNAANAHQEIYPDPSKCPGPLIGAAYFVSFVMFGTMIMLNLFIGVILNSMDEARAEREHDEQEARRAAGQELSVDDDFEAVAEQIDALKSHLDKLQIRVQRQRERDLARA